MPKDNIDAAVKRASGRDATEITEVNYEGKGPHGVMVYVECATDNTNRSVANLKAIFNKNGGEMLLTGALEFLFVRKAVIEFEITEEMDMEEIELALMDAGLEEMTVEDGVATIIGEFKDFGSLTTVIEEL